MTNTGAYKRMKTSLLTVLLGVMLGSGCKTVETPKPAAPSIRRGDFPPVTTAMGQHCPYADMDELHRRLYEEGKQR